MAKLDLDFVLLDESVVDYGYRVQMTGAVLDGFKENPVMLYLHLRGNEGWEKPTNDVLLPIGRWYDIRIEGGRLMAKPEFDDNDEFAQKIESKVKGKYLNAASVWIDPIAVSDDDALKVAGQRGPTITKWGLREGSIVDIPACRNAIAMRNSAGEMLRLSSVDSNSQAEVLTYLSSLVPEKNSSEMDKKILALKLGLPESATDAEINAKLDALNSAAAPNVKLTTENTELKKKVDDMEKAQSEKARTDLVDGGITDGKFTAKERDTYLQLAQSNFDATKALIDTMKPYKSLQELQLKGGETSAAESAELMKLSGKQLWMDGKLARLKEINLEGFKVKYKEAHGVEYK
ncbi:phage protease [Chitinophaga agrisoli]|nr:phage protease [Chitinophaga agrisoli]